MQRVQSWYLLSTPVPSSFLQVETDVGALSLRHRHLELSGDQVSGELVVAPARNHALLYLTYLAGLRIGEALALRTQDIDLDLTQSNRLATVENGFSHFAPYGLASSIVLNSTVHADGVRITCAPIRARTNPTSTESK